MDFHITLVITTGETLYTSVSFEIVDREIYYVIDQSANK